MIASRFSKLPRAMWTGLEGYIGTNFVIEGDEKMAAYIDPQNTQESFRGWKSDCHREYLADPNSIPMEFKDRTNEWKWLVGHFNDPKFKAKSAKMTELKNKPGRANHRSRKLAFCYRAERFLKLGHKAAYSAAFVEVYAKDPAGAALVKEMFAKLGEMLLDQPEITDLDQLEEELPEDMQREIIQSVIANHKGTAKTPKTGAGLRGVHHYLDLEEELWRKKEEVMKANVEAARARDEAGREKAEQKAMMSKFDERLRRLEENEAPATTDNKGGSSGNSGRLGSA